MPMTVQVGLNRDTPITNSTNWQFQGNCLTSTEVTEKYPTRKGTKVSVNGMLNRLLVSKTDRRN